MLFCVPWGVKGTTSVFLPLTKHGHWQASHTHSRSVFGIHSTMFYVLRSVDECLQHESYSLQALPEVEYAVSLLFCAKRPTGNSPLMQFARKYKSCEGKQLWVGSCPFLPWLFILFFHPCFRNWGYSWWGWGNCHLSLACWSFVLQCLPNGNFFDTLKGVQWFALSLCTLSCTIILFLADWTASGWSKNVENKAEGWFPKT